MTNIRTEDWDNILFGISKGLGMVQVLLQSEGEKISKEKFQERVGQLQASADSMRFSEK